MKAIYVLNNLLLFILVKKSNLILKQSKYYILLRILNVFKYLPY